MMSSWYSSGILIMVLAGAVSAAEPNFVGREEFGTSNSIPIAVVDHDRDGDVDVVIGNYGGSNRLYSNEGTGAFVRGEDFGSSWRRTFAVAWADLDNDGDLDLAVGNASNGQPNQLFVAAGDGTYEEFDLELPATTIALAWADYDTDGDLDLALGNGILGVEQQNLLMVNQGDGTFVVEDQFGGLKTGTLVWGDADGDGDLDLAVGNGGFRDQAQNYLYVNNGDGTFTEQEQFGMGDTASMAWGDADGDGDMDLAVGNWENSSSRLYRNNGDGTFSEEAAFGDRDTNTVAWGDFDNDGDLDLAVGNGDFSSAAPNCLYVNDGRGVFTEYLAFGEDSTDGVSWGDVDGDGDLDLAVANEHSTTHNRLFVNQLENPGGSLFVRLIGRFHYRGAGYSNRDAIGARMAVYESGFLGQADHLLGIREVTAHGGFTSQGPLELHFGLAGHTRVDLRIVWPGSAGRRLTQDLTGVRAGRRVAIHEGQRFHLLAGGWETD